MRFGPQKMLDDGAGMDTDRGSPLDQPFWRPFGMGEVGFRHVLAHGGVRTALIRAHVARDAFAAEEHLDGGRAVARPHTVTNQRMRYAVIMLIDIDVVVERHG